MSFVETDAELFQKFVGPKSDYYLKNWIKIKTSKVIISWNWSAFFFHVFWFAYRKMYNYTYFFMSLILFRYYLTLKYQLSKPVDYTLKYLVWLVIGAIANYLYLLHTEKKVKEVISKHEDKYEWMDELERKGGVSQESAIITIFILIFLFMLPVIISVLISTQN